MSHPYDFDVAAQVKQLVSEAGHLCDGGEKIATLEEAVRLADTTRDIKLQFDTREDFIEAAYFGAVPEKAMVAYAWCLAQYDRNPGQFWEWRILWRYKWMVNVITDFPQISKQQIYEMLDDMERRFRAGGHGLRAVYRYRYRTEIFWGNFEKAFEYYRQAEDFRRDMLTDCEACEIDEVVNYRIRRGQDERALVTAQPILQGRYSCRTVPQRTYGRLLLPLLRLDRRDEAWDYHVRGYHMVSRDRALLYYLCDHFVFLSLYGDLEGARLLFERHFHWTQENTNPHDRFLFYRAACLFLELAVEKGRHVLELPRMARSFPLYDASGLYQTAELKDWFETRARQLAAKFDARNENDYFTRELLNIEALKELKAL